MLVILRSPEINKLVVLYCKKGENGNFTLK